MPMNRRSSSGRAGSRLRESYFERASIYLERERARLAETDEAEEGEAK
jgi:hypothetical protein